MLRFSTLGASLCFLFACGSSADFDRRVYDASEKIAPRNPVTGRPEFNVVPEEVEIRVAEGFWKQFADDAEQAGVAVDPSGARVDRLQDVFEELTEVSHRPHLPWQLHLVARPEANAFTPGGGIVVVFEGLFGNWVGERDEAAMAAVLAHEIAHVALLHPPVKVTWIGLGGLVLEDARDPYYKAAYTTEQEAEADRLGVLYMALAGYDPMAASELWQRVASTRGSARARSRYLRDHPLDSERMLATRESARVASRYFERGRRNRHWQSVLADNELFPQSAAGQYRTGSGVLRAATAVLDAYRRHAGATREGDLREQAARDFERIRILGSWTERQGNDELLFVDVYNGSTREVRDVSLIVYYVRGEELILADESCESGIRISPSRSRFVRCSRQSVAGANRVVPAIVDVEYRED